MDSMEDPFPLPKGGGPIEGGQYAIGPGFHCRKAVAPLKVFHGDVSGFPLPKGGGPIEGVAVKRFHCRGGGPIA